MQPQSPPPRDRATPIGRVPKPAASLLSAGKSRAHHFQEANSDLLKAMDAPTLGSGTAGVDSYDSRSASTTPPAKARIDATRTGPTIAGSSRASSSSIRRFRAAKGAPRAARGRSHSGGDS